MRVVLDTNVLISAFLARHSLARFLTYTGQEETNSLFLEQIDQTRKQIERYDFLLTDTSIGLDVVTARNYAASLAELRPKLARLLQKQQKQPDLDPEETITNFYYVLSHLATEFVKQPIDVQKQMMTKLVKLIRVNRLSPHLYSLFIIWAGRHSAPS